MQLLPAGFNIMELVISLLILGILASIAIPKVNDLLINEKITAVQSLAATLSKSNTDNYMLRKQNPNKGFPIANCGDVVKTLKDQFPNGYKITSMNVPVDKTINCTLNGPGSLKATFTATGIK